MTRRGLGRVLAAVALATASLVVATPGAGATPLLETTDADELAATLAEAEETQGICYGWNVVVHDNGVGTTFRDFGSSRGQDVAADTCERYVVFDATLLYTSESSEASDEASFGVVTNVPSAPTEADLRRVGIDGARLLGNDDDVAIFAATVALPALVAERGIAAPVALEENREDIPAGDRPTAEGQSDWMRTNGDVVGVLALVILAGLGWAAWILLFRRRELLGSK